jgi:hypothetical protein
MSLADDVLCLIEQIYAAGVEPARWRDTLLALGARFEACAGAMYTMAPTADQLNFDVEFGTDPEWQALYNAEFAAPEVNPIFAGFR